MYKLVLVRHGQSLWNLENRFTGWYDVDLSETGIKEAREGGQVLRDNGYTFDMAYSSVLKRAIRTLWLVQEEMDLLWIPVVRSWRLIERHYGGLQGLNKGEMAEKYGEEQVHIWRRSYNVRPPALEKSDKRHPRFDRRYADLKEHELPDTECLEDTVARFVPYFEKEIAPQIKSGKRILIAAHGNSLRALVKYLDNVSEEDILKLNIPTGIPLVYELDEKLKPIKHYYLGDEAKIKAAIEGVANQGKKK